MNARACCSRMGMVPAVVGLLALVLMMLMVAGCGGDDPAADATTTAGVETTAAPATTASSAAPASSDTTATPDTTAGAAPAGAPGGTVSVTSTNGGYPKDGAPDWTQIKSVEAYRNASMGVSSLFIMLATDDVTADSISGYWDLPDPAAGQGRIELVLTRTVSGENEPPPVTGTYDFSVPQGQAELTGAVGIVLPGGTTVTFDQSGLESDVQVTAVSDTEVSGTFHVKDKWSEISGTFTAPVK